MVNADKTVTHKLEASWFLPSSSWNRVTDWVFAPGVSDRVLMGSTWAAAVPKTKQNMEYILGNPGTFLLPTMANAECPGPSIRSAILSAGYCSISATRVHPGDVILACAGDHSAFAVACANFLCPTPCFDGIESNSGQLDEYTGKLPRCRLCCKPRKGCPGLRTTGFCPCLAFLLYFFSCQ
jgi:hypothetical protein